MSGPFGSSQWMYASGGFYDFPISNSLRFNDGDTASLARTPGSASNQKTWTLSCWVKRGDISTTGTIFEAAINGAVNTIFYWSGATLYLTGSTSTYSFVLSQLFRDVSAWYHLIIAMDTTQATESNRTKIYINGSIVTAFATETYPSLNLDTTVNSAIAHSLGKRAYDTSLPFDGYLADVNFIDGLQLTPASFGETKNDIWIPKDTSGLTFGTNGFRLEYKQVGTGTASSTTIGADTSGEDNHWTSTNLVASDVVPDSPTNNFATLNPLSKDGHTLSEGNLHVSGNVIEGHLGSTFFVETGKWYYEGNLSTQQGDTTVGLVNSSASVPDNWTGETSNTVGYFSDGRFIENTSSTGYSTYGTSDIAQLAFDADTGEIWIGKNNTWQNSGDPAGGTGEVTTVSWDDFSPAGRTVGSGAMCFNFGQDSSFAGTQTAQGNADGNGIGDFYYEPPSGFLALCTANLPDPVETVDPAQGGSVQDYFNTIIWSGTGSSNALDVGFQPDFTWIKRRNGTQSHNLHNSVNGATKYLISNTNAAEQTDSSILASFDTNGITVGDNTWSNASGGTYASWNWKAGTAFSNDASATGVGSIDSTGSVNTDVGFSIISYTGTGVTATVAHGLGVAPDMILIKNRDNATYNWVVYHSANTAAPETDYLRLNTTDATADYTMWNDTAPTSSVFSIAYDWIYKSSDAHIAYCFASVDGYSKFGSYTGNGVADGPFVYTGFRPAFVMIKNTNIPANWLLFDTARDVDNPALVYMFANGGDAELSDVSVEVDLVSNGFKIRGTSTNTHGNGNTLIYMAFAEQPFKYANAR